jgi:hypothetical protein
MPRRRTAPLAIVPHPRYGSTPIRSGFAVAESELRRGYWRLRTDTLFPETALPADISKQVYGGFPRSYYVDVLRNCRNCKRPFIFFAKEQRYWFETLRFFVDADCVLCPECRRASRVLQRRLRRYSDLHAKSSLDDAELCRLIDDATYLVERDVLKNLSTVGAVKNRAREQVPGYRGLSALIAALDAARNAKSD